MPIFQLIETVYNAMIIMAYTSAMLWAIAAIVNITRYIKRRKKGK